MTATTCTKVRFATEGDALAELATITVRAMQGERSGRSVRHGEAKANRLETGTYECGKCGGWHLSSQPWGGRIVNTRADQRSEMKR